VKLLTDEQVKALLPALANEIATWQDADCGEQQAENDGWVAQLRKIKAQLESETPVERIRFTREGDFAQTDPFMVCGACGEKLCTVEEDDTLPVIVSCAEHECNPLGDPPADLADAWARYQRGDHIEPFELRKLDEWRAERAEEAGY
jgi:hypothetical protein